MGRSFARAHSGWFMFKVMIVDDHALLRRGLRGIIENFPGWEVCGEAGSGEAAVRTTAELQPDVIIMDVSMPGMGGLEATRIIHKAHPAVKIVLLTFHKSTELIRAGFSSGAVGYVLKEGAEDDLLEALRSVVQDKIYVSPAIGPAAVSAVLRIVNPPEADEVSAKK